MSADVASRPAASAARSFGAFSRASVIVIAVEETMPPSSAVTKRP